MNTRVQKLKDRLMVSRYPVCAEKARLIVESLQRTEGEPQIVRRAKATAYYLDNRTIFIEDDELIVGNVASRPMGMEAGSMGPAWPEEDIEDLRKSALFVSDEDAALLRSLDSYWKAKGRTLDERQGQFYDDERLWPFIQSGVLCPPWQNKIEGRGSGSAGAGWGLGLGLCLILPDYAKVLNEGLGEIIRDAEAELKALKYRSLDAIKKADFLRSVLIVIPAIIRIAGRFAGLADEKASKENNPRRKRELENIAEACRHVPANPPRTFYEAMQSFWFIWLMVAGGTTPVLGMRLALAPKNGNSRSTCGKLRGGSVGLPSRNAAQNAGESFSQTLSNAAAPLLLSGMGGYMAARSASVSGSPRSLMAASSFSTADEPDDR